jgi:hypothetical protein
MEYQLPARNGAQSTTELKLLFDLIQQRLDELSDSQKKISTARKELLIERERVKTTGREVQQKRIDAGNAEAEFMSRLRQFVNDCPGELSGALLVAYDKVRQTRDDLGEIEDDYILAENDLAGAEWTFVARENRFYQFDINNILSGLNSDKLASRGTQHFETPNHLPAYRVPPCPPGSLSLSEALKLPPPPPPPPGLRPAPCNAATQSPPVQGGQEYLAIIAEVETLKREFDLVRQEQAHAIEWDDGDDVFFPDGDGLPDSSLYASSNEFGDMVFSISTREAEAQQYKIADMRPAPDIPLMARRFSDPANLYRPAPTTPMRRTQTESAALSMQEDDRLKEKIRAWSLTYLKESAVQKRLYMNILAHYGIADPTESDWKIRAAQFWSHDSLVESGSGNNCHAPSANEVECGLGTSHDQSVTQKTIASPSTQHRLKRDLRPIAQTITDLESRGSEEILQADRKINTSILSATLPLSQLGRTMENMDPNNKSVVVPSDEPALDKEQHEDIDNVSGDDVVERIKCTCPAEYGDTAQRKDSVQSTNMKHRASCSMHSLGAKTHSSMQCSRNIETMMTTPTAHEHCSLTQQNQSTAPHPSTASGPECMRYTTQPASPSPSVQTPIPSASDSTFQSQSINPPNKPDSRPIVQARRSSGSRLWSWIPGVKSKRSKSTPTIDVHRAGVYARKQSVA